MDDHCASSSPEDLDDFTVDSIFGGDVLLAQGRKGYRFNVDSALLAAFVDQLRGRRILDACAGVGVVGIAIARRRPHALVTLVEVQPSLAAFARDNVRRNQVSEQVRVLEEDLRYHKGHGGHFDLAVMNPPYFCVGEGKTSPKGERATARHQMHGALDELISSIHRHLLAQSWLVTVFPAQRIGQLQSALERVGRRRQLIQLIYPFDGQDATLVIIAARSSRVHETRMLSPLVLHSATTGSYTAHAEEILGSGRWAWDKGALS